MNLRPVLAGLALGGIVCACSPHTDKANRNAERYPTDTETGEPTSPSPATTMAFVDEMSGLNLFFVEAGKLAVRSGRSAAVKDYAAAMIRDHASTATALRTVAERAQPAVLAEPRFLRSNPGYLTGKPCVYVGMTGLDPDVRFDKHKAGIQHNRYVLRYGLRLLPDLYEGFNPMRYAEAAAREVEIGIDLRANGWGVWQA